MGKSTLRKWCKKLGFCYKWSNTKMQVYKQFDVDIGIPPVCNFHKNEALAQVFSCETYEFCQAVTLSKTRLQKRFFLLILRILSACTFIKNKTPAQMLSFKTCRFFQPTALLKVRLQDRCFCEFWEFFKTVTLLEKKTPPLVFSCEIWETFKPGTSLSTRLLGIFWRVFRNFSACNFIKNKTPAQV